MTLLSRKLTNKQEPALTVVIVMVRVVLRSRQTATAFRGYTLSIILQTPLMRATAFPYGNAVFRLFALATR